MKFIAFPIILAVTIPVFSQSITVNTTSGRLLGTQDAGVALFKGIRFAHAPVGNLRWEPPMPFVSSDVQETTSLGPSCVQQFPFQGQAIIEQFNTPPPPEGEDCLFLNVWAPLPISGSLRPVIVWFYGGGFTFGTSWLPTYDGTSFAKNQDVVFVSFNYRTNVFGFPTASDLPTSGNNLGLLDQELALAWVQDNIAGFGGDKSKVTLMGHSAGAQSVSLAITRRNSTVVPPFRAGIMLSGVWLSTNPQLNFSIFDAFAIAVGCTQPSGPQRLQCLRSVPVSIIRTYTNGPESGSFVPGVDNLTLFDDPLQRIRTGQIARVPTLLGTTEDDGTIFALVYPNVSTFLVNQFGLIGNTNPFLPAELQALYPKMNDTQLFDAVVRDVWFQCPAKLWSDAFVSNGIKSVYRYTYGAVYTNYPAFQNLGAFHGAELPVLFGTFSNLTASPEEAELSRNLQTAFANFVKNPGNTSPAPNWPTYEANPLVPTLAEIAYHGNVFWGDFVEPIKPNTTDGPCTAWDPLLDFRP